ncbi:hypothetical protein BH721_01335 [Clostridium baratii]|uniref:hypothetical protein n=1 Tax=Clostridium baratii TaxID=1561 RepID=UPI00097FB4D0|nr:hypothetical protein [Clostridium baratii]AQM59269.1 hypothetical protein NPD11_418 [Clostridium baratii]OPF51548.1 hypothetical protein A1M12_03140 [Clostridium baratii]OPF55381.1 hypothetical protein BH721_01335 [Clostridium baratii]OPF57664.1 hypothetical protein BH724_08590 [Clostridium baratii]OPF60238.1 hypothetical protein BH725_06590 [Clostridium baratii]
MLDLDLINEETLDIKLNKEIINVKEPKYSLVIKTKDFFNNVNKGDPIKKQNEILLEFLNNNTNNRKFKEEDIMNMSSKAVTALSKLLIDIIMGTEENPN